MVIDIDERLRSLDDLEKYEEIYQIPAPEACIDFINRFVWTYNPNLETNPRVMFSLFPRQEEFIYWLWKKYKNKECGVVDKSRDVGATWLMMGFYMWQLLFFEGFSGGVYTYKAEECDKIGDTSTILQKARFIIENLPKSWTSGIKAGRMHIQNTLTGSDISGASGDNPNRGGRRSMFFKDESAFYERPEMIEAAVGDVSKCIIDVSTHSGTNTIFYRKTQTDPDPFVFNWWDNPLHTKKWYNDRKAQAERLGLMHVFKREVERDARASVDSVLIPSAWVTHTEVTSVIDDGKIISALDVADEGIDMNSQVIMKGNTILFIDEWSGIDVIETTNKAFNNALKYKAEQFRYDNIGIGAGVKARLNQIKATGHKMEFIGWSAAGAVVRGGKKDYDDRKNSDMFANAKSQAWWKLRDEFFNGYRKFSEKDHKEDRVLTFHEKSDKMKLNKLMNEVSQPTMKLDAKGRILIDKKPKGTKSPNIADALVICRAEVVSSTGRMMSMHM